MWVPKKILNGRGFFKRGIYEKKVRVFFFARIILEKRVLLRAFKIRRGFWSRAFQICSDKKASKTVILEIEKSEEKKNLCSIPAKGLSRKFRVVEYYVSLT